MGLAPDPSHVAGGTKAMRRMIGLAVAAVLLGGCAVYAEPYPYVVAPAPGIYVAPPSVVVGPAYPWWAWHGEWHGGWHHR